jgi:hypothetical protein
MYSSISGWISPLIGLWHKAIVQHVMGAWSRAVHDDLKMPPTLPAGALRQQLRVISQSDPRLLDLGRLYLTIKLALIVVALLGNQLLPFNWHLYNTNLVLDIQNLPDVFRPFNTWDTQHYLFLSQRGYGVNPMSNAFYPLYPFLIWLLTPFFFNKGLIAAYVIANLFSLLVPLYMYKLSCLFCTKEQAFRATVLLLAFPTAFFMSVAYAESLYLATCLMAFYYLFKEDVPKACVFCFLLPLIRAQALLLVAPIFVLFVQATWSKSNTSGPRILHGVRTFLPPAFATLLGMLTYFAFCRWQLGGYFAGLAAQNLYVAKNSIGNLFFPQLWFMNNFVNIHLQLHDYTKSLIDRVAFFLCVSTLVGVYRTQNKALFTYAAVTMLVPAFAGSFMSYTRVLLVVFPMFIYIGARFPGSVYWAVLMFSLQLLFYLLHTSGYWVA